MAWSTYRQTVDELSQLTDAELEDIGLLRVDIHKVARAAADPTVA
ncbi:MAG: DUF1127 domain-containing protein [Pseudomonadota bacterium]